MAYYSPWVFEKGLVLFLQLEAMAAIEVIVYNSCGELFLLVQHITYTFGLPQSNLKKMQIHETKLYKLLNKYLVVETKPSKT